MTCTKCKSNDEVSLGETKIAWGNYLHNGICPVEIEKMKCNSCGHIFGKAKLDDDDDIFMGFAQ